ncbi:Hypothetical protein FKW44_021288 [Caligus rogercresseyi]|uniref:Uncharacterized protein n=1 Tax=Caligus rogercresseyi TaxID=217165 RepID=A0A7T8GR62_CALRO|nr:Hypothetical protein FKW44_021288 [Caligus rogercresseyi]
MPSIPSFFSFGNNCSWSTVSKAAERSKPRPLHLPSLLGFQPLCMGSGQRSCGRAAPPESELGVRKSLRLGQMDLEVGLYDGL